MRLSISVWKWPLLYCHCCHLSPGSIESSDAAWDLGQWWFKWVVLGDSIWTSYLKKRLRDLANHISLVIFSCIFILRVIPLKFGTHQLIFSQQLFLISFSANTGDRDSMSYTDMIRSLNYSTNRYCLTMARSGVSPEFRRRIQYKNTVLPVQALLTKWVRPSQPYEGDSYTRKTTLFSCQFSRSAIQMFKSMFFSVKKMMVCKQPRYYTKERTMSDFNFTII